MADTMKGAPEEKHEILRCPITDEHLDGSRRVSELALQVKHNHTDESIIWAWVDGCVIHQRLLEEFAKREFSGYRLRPATVRFRDGAISKDYRELVVTGWAGVARPESGIRIVKSCRVCHWKNYSDLRDAEQLIDWSQWTGEDFFIVWPLPKFTLITEQVAHLLLELGVRSFALRGLQDLNPLGLKFGFTVARLSNFLPQDLAEKYGKPLDLE
ncbi:MAG TPA: hypothetical protein VFO39_13020 [Candidatus Sulfotelmatobacter sp.]|nr:hypothetical protein [Candidatus Sulfotelmatobacter sp.]